VFTWEKNLLWFWDSHSFGQDGIYVSCTRGGPEVTGLHLKDIFVESSIEQDPTGSREGTESIRILVRGRLDELQLRTYQYVASLLDTVGELEISLRELAGSK